MKKIIGAALAASLLAGTAFADISFSYTGENYFGKKNGSNKVDLQTSDHTDCVSAEISNDICGAHIDWDSDFSGGNAQNLTMDEYYGWMTWGSLKVTAGSFTSRFTNRVTKDKGDLGKKDFELYKLGVVNPDYATIGEDADSITYGKLAVVVDKTFDMGAGKLLVKGAVTKAGFSSGVDAYRSSDTVKDQAGYDSEKRINYWTIKSGFAAEVAYMMDQIALDVIVRNPQYGSYSVGAYGHYEDDQLALTAGVTADVMSKIGSTGGSGAGGITLFDDDGSTPSTFVIGTTSQHGKEMEYAVDFRLRFQLTDNLSFTTMHNLSSWVGIDANAPTKNDGSQNHKNYTGLWDMFNVSYKVDEKVTTQLTLNSYIKDLSADENMFTNVYLTPAVAIQATDHVAVTTGVRCSWKNAGDDKDTFDAVVPLIFSFSL